MMELEKLLARVEERCAELVRYYISISPRYPTFYSRLFSIHLSIIILVF